MKIHKNITVIQTSAKALIIQRDDLKKGAMYQTIDQYAIAGLKCVIQGDDLSEWTLTSAEFMPRKELVTHFNSRVYKILTPPEIEEIIMEAAAPLSQ